MQWGLQLYKSEASFSHLLYSVEHNNELFCLFIYFNDEEKLT